MTSNFALDCYLYSAMPKAVVVHWESTVKQHDREEKKKVNVSIDRGEEVQPGEVEMRVTVYDEAGEEARDEHRWVVEKVQSQLVAYQPDENPRAKDRQEEGNCVWTLRNIFN